MADLFSDQPAPEEGLFSSEPAPEDTGALEAMGRGALRNFPGAQQVAAAAAPYNPFSEKKNYGEEMQHLTKAAEASKAGHPIAYGAGAVAGTAAPALIPVVGGAMEAAPFAANAALGAAQSLSDKNLTQSPLDTAIRGGIGAGIGGGMAYGLGKILPKAAPKIAPEAEQAVEGMAPEAAQELPQAMPVPTKTPGGIIPDQVQISPEFDPTHERIIASNWARQIGFSPLKFKTFAREMGENPETAAKEGAKWTEEQGLIKWLDHPGETLARIGPIRKSEGKFIGDVMEKFGSEPVPAEEIKNQLVDIAERTANPNAETTIARVANRIDKLSERGILDWHAMNELKSMLGEEVKEHPSIARAYGVMAKRMEQMAQSTGERINDPNLLQRYIQAKRNYRMASLIEPALFQREARDLIGGPAGHNTLRGVLGQLVESFSGAPPIGQLVKNAMVKSAPAIRGIGETGAAVKAAAKPFVNPVTSNMGKAAQLELSNFLQSRFGKRANEQ